MKISKKGETYPLQVVFNVENEEDLLILWHRFNAPTAAIWRKTPLDDLLNSKLYPENHFPMEKDRQSCIENFNQIDDIVEEFKNEKYGK